MTFWMHLTYCAFGRRLGRVASAVAVALLPLTMPVLLEAQTDYYNTDAGRPMRVEDATAIEYRAIEIQLAGFRLERSSGGIYHWGVEPEIAAGLLPRTQFEIGLPILAVDGGGLSTTGLAGVHVRVLHNLNTETSIPAFAIAGELRLPAGGLGPRRAYPSVKGIATRSLPAARVHVNAQVTLGNRIKGENGEPSRPGEGELSRWLLGVAVDRAIALRSLLITGELVARQPLLAGEDVEWSTGGGVRYQLSPRVAGDAGAGYRLTGGDRGWFVTAGAAVAIGLPWSP